MANCFNVRGTQARSSAAADITQNNDQKNNDENLTLEQNSLIPEHVRERLVEMAERIDAVERMVKQMDSRPVKDLADQVCVFIYIWRHNMLSKLDLHGHTNKMSF